MGVKFEGENSTDVLEMKAVEGRTKFFEIMIPAGSYTSVKFSRREPDSFAQWGSACIVSLPDDGRNQFEMDSSGYGGTWTAYVPVTDKEKVNEAKPLAEAALNSLSASNAATADEILNTVKEAIASAGGVDVSWKAIPVITEATSSVEGSVTGAIDST